MRFLILVSLVLLVLGGLSLSTGYSSESSIVLDGQGSPVDVSQALRSLSSGRSNVVHITVINAPGTIIEKQKFSGVNLTLVDSPNSKVLSNIFTSYKVSDTSYSILQILRSDDTAIEGNSFDSITLTDTVENFIVIDVEDSTGITVYGNNIAGITSSNSASPLSFEVISATYVETITVSKNTVTKVDIVGLSDVSLSLFGFTEVLDLQMISNYGSAVDVLAKGDIFASGISVKTMSKTPEILINVDSNQIDDFVVHSTARTVTTNGIYVNTTVPSTGKASSLTVSSNTVTNMVSTGDGSYPQDTLVTSSRGISIWSGIQSPALIRNAIDTMSISSPNTKGGEQLVGVEVGDATSPSLDRNSVAVLKGGGTYDFRVVDSIKAVVEFEYGKSFPVQWVETDPLITDYLLDLDSSTIAKDLYVPGVGISLDIPSLSSGSHLYSINLQKTDKTSYSNSLSVIISDITAPVITGDYTLEISAFSSVTLNWTVTDDLLLSSYSLYLNSSLVQTSGFTSTTEVVSYFFKSNESGVFEFKLEAVDTSSNLGIFVTMVTVTPISDLVISGEADFTMKSLSNRTITWVVGNISSYNLYINGSSVASTYSDGNVTYTFIPDHAGGYNLTLVIMDSLGRTASNTVLVTVVLYSPAVFNYGSKTISAGTTGENIEWTIIDSTIGNYSVYRDGISILNGSYFLSDTVRLSLDGLGEGTFNYTIMVVNAYNMSTSNSVSVTVYTTGVNGGGIGGGVFTSDPAGVDGLDFSGFISTPVLIGVGALTVGAIGVIILRRRA